MSEHSKLIKVLDDAGISGGLYGPPLNAPPPPLLTFADEKEEGGVNRFPEVIQNA